MMDARKNPDDQDDLENVDRNITKAVIGIIVVLIIIIMGFYFYNKKFTNTTIAITPAPVTKTMTPATPIATPSIPTPPPPQTNSIMTKGSY